jgi:hypothetical protein
MDNIENSEPVGEEGATPSPDNSANDTQTAEVSQETPEGVSDVPVAEGETEAVKASNPWDTDPRFKGKTPDEMFKIVQEADRYKGTLGRKAKIADLIEQKYGVTPEQLEAQIEQQEYQKRQALYANNPLAPIVDEVQQLKQKVAQQEQEKALSLQEKELDKFLKDNPDYVGSRDKILKLALTPGIGFNPETGEETSFEDLAKEWIGTVRAEGQQDAYKKIDVKKQTQQTQPSSAPSRKISQEDLEKMPIEDLRAYYGVK